MTIWSHICLNGGDAMQASWKQLLKGTFAGGLAIFMAHGIGWGALPFTNRAITNLSDPHLLRAIDQHASVQPGTYFINANQGRMGLAVPEGVYGWATLHPAEAFSEMRAMGLSLLIELCTAFLASWIVLAGRLTSFGARFRVGLSLAALGVLGGPAWDWAWGWYSGPYALAVGLNTAGGLVAMAAVVAWLVKPQAAG